MRVTANDSGFKRYLPRPFLLSTGEVVTKMLRVCECGKRKRGPEGGGDGDVCGNCCGAIPIEKHDD